MGAADHDDPSYDDSQLGDPGITRWPLDPTASCAANDGYGTNGCGPTSAPCGDRYRLPRERGGGRTNSRSRPSPP
jgi:hypothetical protein